MQRKVSAVMCALAAALLLAACGGRDGPPPGGPGGPGGPGAEIPDDDDYGPIDAADPSSGGVARPGKPGVPGAEERYSSLKFLKKYVVEKDGSLTRAQLEAGLKADFAADDTNHDGKLGPDEVRAVNSARWKEAGAAASPLTDWNEDGGVDFSEFSAMARTLFDTLDLDHNGMLSPKEIRATPQKPEQKTAPPERPGPGGRRGGPGG